MSNKHAASEDDVGKLHKLITMVHNMKAGAMMKLAAELLENGIVDLAELNVIIDSKQMATMQKWVEYNGVSCLTADMDEESELSKRLKDLKKTQSGKVVQFADLSAEG